jgi:phosphoglycolate phosphatase
VGEPGPFEGLIFDLDGTLWSTVEVCARAWNEAQRSLGPQVKSITAEDVKAVTGLTQEEIFRRLFPGHDEASRQLLGERCMQEEDVFLDREGGQLYPGVVEGLIRLAERYRLAIVSNCQTGYIERFLEKNALATLFCDIECHGNTGLTKRDNIVRLVERQKLKRCVYIGDTLTDERAAHGAGLPFYWAAYGFGVNVPSDRSFAEFSQLVSHFMEES